MGSDAVARQGSSLGFGAALAFVAVFTLMNEWGSFERDRIAALLGALVGLGAVAHLVGGPRRGGPWDTASRLGLAAFVLTVVALNLPRCVGMLLEGAAR
jgi:peptidoglycan/LPS O-acetylase OafA/YrhL